MSGDTEQSPRTLALIGARAAFTATVLAGLLEEGVVPAAIALHAPPARGALPVRTPHLVDRLAGARGIPVHDAPDAAAALAVTAASGAAVGLVACYPRRLPVDTAALPPAGLFNLHPSPLPAFRGPSPLFWQFRAGHARTAVTLHRVAIGFDTGPVLAREWLALAPGDAFERVNARLAALGAALAVRQLVQAPVVAAGEPQDEACASQYPVPTAADFAMSADWPAERIYRFVAGTAAWGRSCRLQTEQGDYHVDRVLGFERKGVQSRPVVEARGERLWIRCRPGVVQAVGGRLF